MFSTVLKFFGVRENIEVEVDTNLGKEEIVDKIIEKSAWKRIEDEVLTKYIQEKISLSLAEACYTEEEINQTRAASDYVLEDLSTQGKFTQEYYVKKLEKKFPKAVMVNADRSYAVRGFYKFTLPFNHQKLIEKLTKEVKEKVYECEKS